MSGVLDTILWAHRHDRKVRYRRPSASSAAAFAHHAYTAEFDTTKPIKLTGVLTKLEWTNPHIWLYLDVKDENGKITNWGFSASPPGNAHAGAASQSPA